MRSMTEQEAVVKSVEKWQSSSSLSPLSATLMGRSIGGMPINEFTTEGYFTCVFPTLFPIGAADFSGRRQNQVRIKSPSSTNTSQPCISDQCLPVCIIIHYCLMLPIRYTVISLFRRGNIFGWHSLTENLLLE